MPGYDDYDGIFMPINSQSVGHLRIKGSNSLLTLLGSDYSCQSDAEFTDIHGVLNNGAKASLLDCVFYGQTTYLSGDNHQIVERQFFPNYIVIGDCFLGSEQKSIRAVRYHFKGVKALINARNTFKSVNASYESIFSILKEDHNISEDIANRYGWSKEAFAPEITDNPQLLYFSGKWEIASFESDVGNISFTNRATQRFGDSSGIGINNEICVNIEFSEIRTLQMAVVDFYYLHNLLEISLGQRQAFQWIEIEFSHRKIVSEHEMYQSARLYWSLCNNRVKGDSKTHPADVLLSPDQRPSEFANVVAGWINSAPTMRDPRQRFATAFFGNYGIDRIVAAANMFDLCPESRIPQKKETDAATEMAVKQCRAIFKSLPDSAERQSVLSALGRVGTASLRDKVYHQASKIISTSGEIFDDLYLPCKHAVIARNHYVHGSKSSFDYERNFSEFSFLSDTLEFVFAVSDLIDMGWDLNEWVARGSTLSHPFGVFYFNYGHNIQKLKRLVV